MGIVKMSQQQLLTNKETKMAKQHGQVSVDLLMKQAPILKDGSFPPLDLWIFVATRLIERVNRGGVIQRNRDGFFAGGESAINAIYCGDVSDRYFNELLPVLKGEADKDAQYGDLKQWLQAGAV